MKPIEVIKYCKESKGCENCTIRFNACRAFKYKYDKLPCLYYDLLDSNARLILRDKEDV